MSDDKWIDDAGIMYHQQRAIERLQSLVDLAVEMANYYAITSDWERAKQFLNDVEASNDTTL